MKAELTGDEENLKYTKPCRVDGVTSCIQYPEDDPCGCDWCADCPTSIAFKAGESKC